ncbi:MAG: glycosyltransferase [Pseudomonadota bacterium]
MLWLSLGILYFILGLDDLWVVIVAYRNQLKPTALNPQEKRRIANLKQRKIAIVIPAWRESNIISQMLRGNLNKIVYDNYHIFVGCYPNDLPTYRAASKVARDTGRVTPILNVVPGPTSKGQLLNAILRELSEGHYPQFDLFLFHDAEDIIHPLSLQLINSEAARSDFIQIPVFSLPIKRSFSVGATYMDEFAEVHTRDLLVRIHLGVSIPSAGVGFALTRKALYALIENPSDELFDSSCLTEDYVLGIRAHQAGLKQSFPCVFEPVEGNHRNWIATFEYFPKRFTRSIKQKARWTEGISLQSAKKLGWFGNGLNWLFLFRDRKALLSNCLGLFGLMFLPLMAFFPVDEPWFLPVGVLNSFLLINRLWQRTVAFKRVYQNAGVFEVILRYPLGVLINGLAGFLALKSYSASRVFKEPTAWVKTEHELPEGFGQTAAQGVG